MRDRVGCELRLEGGEMFEEQDRQVTTFTEREQVLMDGINAGLGVVFDDAVGDDNRMALIRSSDSI